MKSSSRLVGIDYLRAFFSVCVVAVHLGYVFPSDIFRKDRFQDHSFGWSDFVNFYVLCLAVPVFILVSAYLFALKPTNLSGLWKRLGRIGRLLVFWCLLYQVFYFTGYGALKLVPTGPREIALFVLTAGNSVYYFFVSLIIVTLATYSGMRQSTRVVWISFAISTAVVGLLPILHRESGFIFYALHANPLNFLPLAYAGIGLARMTHWPLRLALAMLALAGASALLDWTIYVDPCFFKVNRFAIPAYSRPSLIFLAVAVLILALRFNPPGNFVVRFMARHSLGLYCLHPFFMPVGYKLVLKMNLTGAAEVLIPLAAVIGLSYLGSVVMAYFLRDELIR